MKHIKISFIVIFLLLGLVIVSCVPGGTQPAQGWSGTVFYDNTLYTGSRDGKVIAVDPVTRGSLWSYAIRAPSGGFSCGGTSGSVAIYGNPTAMDDLVCIGAYDGRVYALNRQTGNERWIYPKDGDVGQIVGNSIAAGGNIYFNSSDGRVYALNTTYGEEIWKTEKPLSEKLWTSPLIDGDIIYVTTYEGYIYSLSINDGSLLPWSFKADAGIVSSPVIYQDTIFMGAFDNSVYAVKIGSNEPLWSFSGDKWFWATPVVKDGVVYAGCLDGKVYAIGAGTGELKWEFDTGSQIVSPPVIDGDLLIVASESGDINVFNTNAEPVSEAMVPVQSMSVDALIKASFCVEGDTIYLRAEDDRLYAMDMKTGWVIWSLPLGIKGES